MILNAVAEKLKPFERRFQTAAFRGMADHSGGDVVGPVRDHFVPPHSHRSAIAIHVHRLAAMAEWKSVTLTAA